LEAARSREGLAFGHWSHRIGRFFQWLFYFSFICGPPTCLLSPPHRFAEQGGKAFGLAAGFVSLVDFCPIFFVFTMSLFVGLLPPFWRRKSKGTGRARGRRARGEGLAFAPLHSGLSLTALVDLSSSFLFFTGEDE
jgi:hypothetical protein